MINVYVSEMLISLLINRSGKNCLCFVFNCWQFTLFSVNKLHIVFVLVPFFGGPLISTSLSTFNKGVVFA